MDFFVTFIMKKKYDKFFLFLTSIESLRWWLFDFRSFLSAVFDYDSVRRRPHVFSGVSLGSVLENRWPRSLESHALLQR